MHHTTNIPDNTDESSIVSEGEESKDHRSDTVQTETSEPLSHSEVASPKPVVLLPRWNAPLLLVQISINDATG